MKNQLITAYESTHTVLESEFLLDDIPPDDLSEIGIEFMPKNMTCEIITEALQCYDKPNDEVSQEFRKIIEKEGIKYDVEVFQRAFGIESNTPGKVKSQRVRRISKRIIGALTCDFCGIKGFKNRQAFVYHLRNHMKGRFFCALCKASFRSSDSLKIHLTTYHGHIKRNIPCPFPNCFKSYANATALRAHFSVHKKDGFNQSFVCDTCGKFLITLLEQLFRWRFTFSRQRIPLQTIVYTAS